MRFLVDAQLPPALARRLAAAGHQAEHVGDRGMQAAGDEAIWDMALREKATIITKDADFAHRHALSDCPPSVIWVRLHNTRRSELLARFASVLPEVLAAFGRGETLVEVIDGRMQGQS